MEEPIDLAPGLKKLGYSGLRPQQEKVLEQVFGYRNVIGVLPTSAGKSTCYQLPAVLRDGAVVVLSPLVALMQDQVDRLNEKGIPAVALHSHLSSVEKKKAFADIAAGNIKLVYVSPERLSGLDPRLFGDTKIQLYAIDEAHCISEWGHDFRPAYLRVGATLRRWPRAPIAALTATATSAVVDEIGRVLGIEHAAKLVWSPDRPNLTYGIAGDRVGLVRLIAGVGTPSVVYGSTKISVEDACAQLLKAGYRAAFYHAGMSKEDRKNVQNRFRSGDIEVIAATCAFGMGIDHPGIRSVIHLEVPTSLEAYIQETGRAGRDGSPCKVVCRATVDTLDVAKGLVPLMWPIPARVRLFHQKLTPLWAKASAWSPEGTLQMSNEEISSRVGMEPVEVDSCLRILQDAGILRRTPYRDRPVTVSLLKGAHSLKGKKQRQIVDALLEHADENDEVSGSVRFFAETIGLDKGYADDLVERGALRLHWVERCQILELTKEESVPELDEDRILSVRARAFDRIEAARGLLYTNKCRRRHMLDYFGAEPVGDSGDCCDLCRRRKKTVAVKSEAEVAQ